MDFIKNTGFITGLWLFLGAAVVLVGGYREYLYRENDKQQQDAVLNNQKQMNNKIEKQTALINGLVTQGIISAKVAHEIVNAVATATGSVVVSDPGNAVAIGR